MRKKRKKKKKKNFKKILNNWTININKIMVIRLLEGTELKDVDQNKNNNQNLNDGEENKGKKFKQQ